MHARGRRRCATLHLKCVGMGILSVIVARISDANSMGVIDNAGDGVYR